MMSNLKKYQEDLKKLILKSDLLYYKMGLDRNHFDTETKSEVLKLLEKSDIKSFSTSYESWYSEAYSVIKVVLPSRLDDFVLLYKNEKRKKLTVESYTIKDYLMGLTVNNAYGEVIIGLETGVIKFEMQKNILLSAKSRFESSLFDIQQLIQADMFDDELSAAQELLKQGFLRAAGAIAGVVLEKHLSQVCHNHNITIRKKNPTINDFNENLKSNQIIDVPTWRFIQHLGDIRNLCDHNKEREPKKEEVSDLIKGVDKIIKSIF